MLCTQIVPHPKNRCGGIIRSARARSLAASILIDGYDPSEACFNNLLVEAAVDENGQVDRKFTEHYLATAGKDRHTLIDPCAVAEYGALCNSTGNIVNRNIRGGKLGCACDPPAMAGDCTCKAKPILDDKGYYSLDKLRSTDNDWYLAVMGGYEWEILDCAIDIEEPRGRTCHFRRLEQGIWRS